MPESLLVVGGGYIGLEMGTVYAALGSRVSVVEMTDGLLPGVDRDLVKPLHKKLEKRLRGDLAQHEGRRPGRQEGFDRGDLRGRRGREGRSGSAACWWPSGRRPNSAGLGLEKTKVQVDPRGFVVVDPQRRTADPHILAIGDVAGEPMLAHKAAHEGKVAAEVLAGHSRPRSSPGPSRPWSSPTRRSPGPA